MYVSTYFCALNCKSWVKLIKIYFNLLQKKVAKATYASFAVIYLYSRFKKNKKKSVEKSQNDDLNHTQVLEDNSFENFRCPHCECSIDKSSSDKKLNADQDLPENLPTLDPDIAIQKSNKSSHNQNNGVSAAEAFVKSSKSKCESGCKSINSTPFKTTNEHKSLFYADDKECVLSFPNKS